MMPGRGRPLSSRYCSSIPQLKIKHTFPLLIPADQAVLSKVSNSYDKFRQTVGDDSGKGRLFSRKSWLQRLTEMLVGHSVFRGMSWIL
jgi:hypothetical protein